MNGMRISPDVRSAQLLDPFEAAVAGFEVQVRRPVVTEVIRECTGGAACAAGDVAGRH